MRAAQTLISDDWLRSGVDALVILVEAAGALVIVVGRVPGRSCGSCACCLAATPRRSCRYA